MALFIPTIEMGQTKWSKRTTFADVGSRDWALQTPAAQQLRKALPDKIWEAITNVFLSGNMKSAEAKKAYDYLLENSEFFQKVKERPSDAYIFNYLYRYKKVENEIDKFFPLCKSAIAIYERLAVLREKLPQIIEREIIRQKIRPGKKFLIDNMASGDAPECIEMMKDNPGLISRVHIRCIDNDSECLERAQKRVAELGLTEAFEFVCEDIKNVRPRKANLVLAIGVFCPVHSKPIIKALEAFRLFARNSGIVIFSTVQMKMIMGDPLCDFMMRFVGWKMAFKKDNEPSRIATASGWKPESYFDDCLGYNRMTIARQTDSLKLKLKRLALNTKCFLA